MKSAAGESIERTLHFDLGGEGPYTLRAFGRGHRLEVHSEATRAASPELQRGEAIGVTHYARVAQPRDAVQLVRVYGPPDEDGIPSLELVAVCTPDDAGAYTRADLARALLFLHPGLTVLTAAHAPVVLDHIGASPSFQQMCFLLENMDGPWNEVVKLTEGAGAPLRDAAGRPLYRYDLAALVENQRTAVAREALIRVNGDPALRAVRWNTSDGVPNVDISPGRTHGTAAAAAPAGYRYKLQDAGPRYGLSAEVLSLGDDLELRLRLRNDYVRHGSVFISLVGGDGKTAIPVPPETWIQSLADDLRGLVKELTDDFRTRAPFVLDGKNELNFLGTLGAETTFLGVPVSSSSSDFAFRLPMAKLPSGSDATISKVRILCGSLGLRTDNEWDPLAAWIGIALTAFLDIAIPTISLVATVGTVSNKLFDSIFKDVKFLGALAVNLVLAVTDSIQNPDQAGEDVKRFFLALGDTIVQKVLTAADVAEKLAAYFGGEELAEAIPIAGWALKAEAIEAGIEQLAQTVGEVVGSPRVVEFDVTITMDARLTLRPSEKGGFASRAHHYTITAQYSDVTGYVYTADIAAPDVDRIDALWKDIPVGGTVKFLVAVYSEEGWLVGRGASDTIPNAVTPGEGALVVPPILVEELLYPLTSDTTYGHQQLLAYQGGAHRWIRSSVPPPETVKDLETGEADHGLDALTSLGLNSDLGVLGYSWEASGQNVPILGTQEPVDEVCYTFQNVSYGPAPEAGLMFTPAGYASSPLLGYLRSSAGGDLARAFFYLDPVADEVGAFHLRSVAPVTDAAVPPESPRRRFDLARTQSWGRFRIRPTSIALHPNGCVVAVSSGVSKLQILELPRAALAPGQAPWAQVVSGPGVREGLLGLPELVAVAPDQTIYVLEAGNARIQAFSRGGHPVRAFPALPTPYGIPLHAEPGDSSTITYTSMSVEIQGHVYVSSYEDTGYEPRQFRLDIYGPDGRHLLRQRGVNVARQAVDLWRNLYTLNFQRVLGPAGRTEPSVSEWAPFTPRALAGLRAGGGFQVHYPGVPTLLGACLIQNTHAATGVTWNMRTFYQDWNWDQQQPEDVDGYGLAIFNLDGGNDASTWNLWWVGPNRCAIQASDSGRFVWIAEYGQGNYRAQPFVSHDRPSPSANTSADPYGYFTMAHLGGGIVALQSLDPGGGPHPLSFRYGEYFEPFDTWNVIRAIDGAPGADEALRLPQLDPLVILLLTGSGVGLDLRGKDLTFAGRITSIAGVDFTGAHLEGARFGALTELAGCNFTGAHLNGASLACHDPGRVIWGGADLSGVDLREFDVDPRDAPDLSRTTLDGANLSGLPLSGVRFAGASMKGADLTGADVRGASFAGADLRGAHLDGASCLASDFTGADLGGATLAGAKLGGSKLQGARFDGCDLTRTALGDAPQFGRSTAARTRFVNARIPAAQLGRDWSYLDLTGATIADIPKDLTGLAARETLFPTLVGLRGVRLSGADLSQARMYYADLKGADLGAATLDGALLKGANLAGANLAGASLQGAYLVAETHVDDPDKYEAAQATDAFLVNTRLDGARCDGVDFVGALFITYAPLSPRPASADGAFMNGAKFNDARIIGVSFRGAQLAGVNLSNAVLVASTFPSAVITPTSDALHSPASLYRADLRGARFADLGPGGRLVNPANMDGCDLTGATVATAPGTFQQVYEGYDGKRLPVSVGYDATVLGTTTPATHCPDGSSGPCAIARPEARRAGTVRRFPSAEAVARPPEAAASESEPARPMAAPTEAAPPAA